MEKQNHLSEHSGKNQAAGFKLKDRKLGDEWADWDGAAVGGETVCDEDRRIFIGFAFLCLVAMILFSFFIFYMIYPRLAGWNHILARGAMVVLILASLAVALWFAAIFMPLLSGIRFPWRMEFVQKTLNFLVPITIHLGGSFGVGRDRMSNSFIKVSNALVRSARINTDRGPLMVLLPRCLVAPVRSSIQKLCDRYKCLVFTVPGGELARQLIHDHNPSRIIAVACERDLVSGIQDVAPVIPTYAVPNCRPEGPCKNTIVDLKLIEEALILFSPPQKV